MGHALIKSLVDIFLKIIASSEGIAAFIAITHLLLWGYVIIVPAFDKRRVSEGIGVAVVIIILGTLLAELGSK